MRKKVDPKLLSEEVSRFRRILEYSFYTGMNTIDEDDTEDDTEDTDSMAPPEGGESDPDAAIDAVGGDLGINDTPPAEGDIPPTGDTPPVGDVPAATDAATPPADGLGNGTEPPPMEDDSVEVDVTSLVKGNKETQNAADLASKNSVQLMAKFSELEDQVARMGGIAQKIDALEKEIVKRNPTNVEKLEMQSLHSFPYSVKLSDYWNDKEGPYDVTTPQEEFILTQGEVDSTYNESAVKNSFKQMPNNLYEEEEI